MSFLSQVGKQFDALVIDTAAPSHYPVFDTFTGESFDVREIHY